MGCVQTLAGLTGGKLLAKYERQLNALSQSDIVIAGDSFSWTGKVQGSVHGLVYLASIGHLQIWIDHHAAVVAAHRTI